MLNPGVGEQVQDAGHMTEHLPDTLTALDFQTIRTATKLEGEGTEMQTLPPSNKIDRYTVLHAINNQACQYVDSHAP